MKQLLLITLLCFSAVAFSQELKKSAQEKFNNQDWAGAAKDYTKYLKKNKTDSAAWYSLGMCQINLEDYDGSIKSLTTAKETNFNKHLVNFNLAKIYSKKNDPDNMLATLEKAAEEGLFTYTGLKNSPEFESYQEKDRFQKVLRKVELNAYPCLSWDKARHFDFWLGEWDVLVNGNKVGENSITMAKGGCAIHENYTTARNYAGQSINFYSPVDEKWHQHWVGSSGDVYNYVEVAKSEGMLQFQSDFKGPTGQLSLSRLTFTLNEDGTVRQLFESSTDNGKTWTPAFDGLYKKKD